MRRNRYSTVLVLCAFLFGLALVPKASWAHEATPTTLQNEVHNELCTSEQIAKDGSIMERPRNGALVSPSSSPDMDLYVVEISLPVGSCVSFTGHYLHDGAIIWFVQSGKVEFEFLPFDGRPLPDLMWQTVDSDEEPATSKATLKEGDWVSADRAVNYSYRNVGTASDGDEGGNAVVIMTALEKRVPYDAAAQSAYDGGNRCKGVCRR